MIASGVSFVPKLTVWVGVEVIAVDRYANAPAHQVAHRSHVIDMTDAAALRRIIDLERPRLIVPEIEAIATEVLLQVEAEGMAQVVPTARAAHLTMNREGIRRLAAEELGLATSQYAFASSFDELQAAVDKKGMGYPCIIKPVMSSSGKGQSRVDSPDALRAAWEYAGTNARVSITRVIVESVVDFEYEITLLTVRSLDKEGKVDTSGGRVLCETNFCDPIGHRQVRGDYVESWQPHPMSERALAKAKDMAARVTGALGGRGLFGVELFVKGDEVWFSEVSPRPHDTGMVTMVTQAQNEFELHVRAILGLPVGTRMRRAGASAVIYGGMDAPGVTFEGIDDALRIPETSLRLFGKPVSYDHRRMGVALAAGDTIDIARKRAKECAAKIRPRVVA